MGNRKRTSRNPDARRLWVAVGFSLTLHALIAVVWIVNPPSLTPSDNPDKAPPVVRFGIDQSQHQTIAWLGFIDPTPHQAQLSVIDQSALSPEISEAPSSESASSVSTVIALRIVEAGSSAKASLVRWIAQGQLAIVQLVDSAGEAAQKTEPTVAEPNERENAEEQAETAEPTEPDEPTEDEPEADDSTKVSGSSTAAIESPKESDAFSRDKVLAYHNGKVASRQGLDIKTVKPKWLDATLLTANPRNPLVRIEFGSDGRVKKAKFEGIGSGYDAVDHSLLNAIYAWTATGKEIDELIESDPDGVVVARVRFRLR